MKSFTYSSRDTPQFSKGYPLVNQHRPWQIGVGRLVFIKNWWFSGSMFIYQRVKWIIGMGWVSRGFSLAARRIRTFSHGSWNPYAPRNKYVHLRLRRVFEIRRACWYTHTQIYIYIAWQCIYICISYPFICHKWSTWTFWKNNHPAWSHECLVIFIYIFT